MAYKPKYRIAYTDHLGKYTTVDIGWLNYPGTVTELTATDVPLVLSWPNDDDNRFAAVRGSMAEIQFYADDPYTYTGLFTGGKREWMVQVFKGTESSDILLNREFWGSTRDWTAQYIAWSEGCAKVSNTTLNAYIKQTISLSADTYTVDVYYSNAATNDTLYFEWDSTQEDATVNCNTTAGTHVASFDFTLASPEASKEFKINKSYTGEAGTSNLKILKVELHTGTPSYDFTRTWAGFIYPSRYRQTLGSSPYTIKVAAHDGIGDLKNSTFKDTDGSYLFEENTLKDTIFKCLYNTGVFLGMNSAVNLEHNATSTDDYLDDTSINSVAFLHEDDFLSAYDVLNRICTAHNCRIYQDNGLWKVIRFEEYGATFDYSFTDKVWNTGASGSYASLYDITDPNPASGEDILCLMEVPELEVELPIKQIDILNGIGYQDNYMAGDPYNFNAPHWESASSLYEWTEAGSIDLEKSENNELQINDYEDWGANTKYIEVTHTARANGAIHLNVGMKVFPFSTDASVPQVRARLYIDHEGDVYNNSGWGASATLYWAQYLDWNKWNDIEIDDDDYHSVTAGDDIDLRIYAPESETPATGAYDYGMLVKDVFIRNNLDDKLQQQREETETIDADNEEIKEIEMHMGVPITSYTPADMFDFRLYKGSLLSAAATPITSVSKASATGTYTCLTDMLVDDYADAYSQPREILRGTVHGYLGMSDALRDTNHSNTSYMVHSLRINDKMNMNEVELYEIP